jgi:alpha-1,3-glucan synthase
MRLSVALSVLPFLVAFVSASPYRADLVNYNLNVNQNAQNALEYATSRSNTTYNPSPENWRALPVYTVLMDKFADGDPSNNDYFGTMYESDWRETQLRYGGDLKGLVSKLDYLAGMGIKVIFISGTPFLNMIWEADSTCCSSPRTSLFSFPYRLFASGHVRP